MKAITVRNLPPEVAQAIRRKAKKEGVSLNRAVVRLLEEALGIDRSRNKVVHHDLDSLFGCWSKEEADQFNEALREQRQIDAEMWK